MSLFTHQPQPNPALAKAVEEYASDRMAERGVKYSRRDGQLREPQTGYAAGQNDGRPHVRYSISASATDAINRAITASGADPLALRSALDSRREPTFTQTVQQHLQQRSLKSSDVYRSIGMDRRHFSKILSNPDYSPSRDTAIALAIGLRLSLTEANQLLSRAGFSLSNSSRRDMLIEYFFERKNYSIDDLNDVLFTLEEKILET